MFLRIFVPLDGSSRAERALDLAALLARQTTMREPAREPLLILFQAVALSPWLDLDEREAERTQAVETATRYLEEQAERLQSEGITVETSVRLGNPAEAILEQTVARQVELIVMSTHGRSGLARWALGSVAERVARTAPVPVLLLPDAAPATLIATETQPTATVPRIFVPLDGSAKAEAALPAAIEMARLLGGEVRLLYVFVPRFEESSLEEAHRHWDAGRRRVHQVERYLTRQAEIVQHAGIKAHWAFGSGMPAAKIIDTAHSQQVSLIVMTTQGRGGLVRWRLGSVTEEVLHYGRLPVLLAPSYEAEAQQSPKGQDQWTLAKEMP
jgi:nucleotide-binding universal stress UspA family protein